MEELMKKNLARVLFFITTYNGSYESYLGEVSKIDDCSFQNAEVETMELLISESLKSKKNSIRYKQ